MKKSDAIKIFGTRSIDLAKALGRHKSAISQWNEDLDDDKTNLVLGAALRAGKTIPAEFINQNN